MKQSKHEKSKCHILKKGCLKAYSAPIRSAGYFFSNFPTKSLASSDISLGKVILSYSTFLILVIVSFLLM